MSLIPGEYHPSSRPYSFTSGALNFAKVKDGYKSIIASYMPSIGVSLRLSSTGYIYNRSPLTAEKESLKVNWVGGD